MRELLYNYFHFIVVKLKILSRNFEIYVFAILPFFTDFDNFDMVCDKIFFCRTLRKKKILNFYSRNAKIF